MHIDLETAVGSAILSAAQANPGYLGPRDNFIAKLVAVGNYLWAVQLGEGQAAFLGGIAADTIGDIYATGSFASYSVQFGINGLIFCNRTYAL